MFVNAIMYYKVKDATLAVSNVDDYSGSSRLLAATTLRNILGTRNLGDILSERESIATEMKVHHQISSVLYRTLIANIGRGDGSLGSPGGEGGGEGRQGSRAAPESDGC